MHALRNQRKFESVPISYRIGHPERKADAIGKLEVAAVLEYKTLENVRTPLFRPAKRLTPIRRERTTNNPPYKGTKTDTLHIRNLNACSEMQK